MFDIVFQNPVYLQAIMKDKWMNVGYEDEELKPYVEPETDFSDARRMGKQGELFLCYTVASIFSLLSFFLFFSIFDNISFHLPILYLFLLILLVIFSSRLIHLSQLCSSETFTF